MFRKITSLTILFSGILVVVTSIVLYIGPPVHIAYFSDWRMLGVTKNQWNALHIMNGIVFIVGGIVHVAYNWRLLLRYLKNRSGRVVVFTLPCAISLVITILVSVDAILFLPPARQVFRLGHSINHKHIREYGVFPFGRPDVYTLKKAAMYMGCDPQETITALRDNNIKVESDEQSIREIAETNGIPMSTVLDIIKRQGNASPSARLYPEEEQANP